MRRSSVLVRVLLRVLAPGLALMAAGGCVGEPLLEQVGRRPIVGGQSEAGYPAVGTLAGMFEDEPDRAGCTGTLIGPRVVLTAKHCVRESTQAQDLVFEAGGFQGRGVAMFSQGELAREGRVPPHDILVLVLDQALPVAPASYRRTPLTGAEGRSVHLVGFGFTGKGLRNFGTKHSGVATIYDVYEDEYGAHFTTTRRPGRNSTICFGDSGGPVFLDGQVAGVISGTWNDCLRLAVHTSVGHYLHLIVRAELAAEERAGSGGQGDDDRRQGHGGRNSGWRGADAEGGNGEQQGGDASCEWSNDGECDEPESCAVGTDGSDCDRPWTCDAGYCADGDGWYDEDLDCCWRVTDCYDDDACCGYGDCCDATRCEDEDGDGGGWDSEDEDAAEGGDQVCYDDNACCDYFDCCDSSMCDDWGGG